MIHCNVHKQGFTLIELLVVIALIAILAATLIGSLTIARERGQAAKIVGDVRMIKDAIQSRYSEQVAYPTESALEAAYPGLASSPMSISNMINEGVFEGAFTSAPVASVGNGVYMYDADASDGDTFYPFDGCGDYTDNEYGVNIVIENAIATHPNVIAQLDDLVDSADGLDCGRVRRASATDNSVLYNLAVHPTIFP